jgi:hypothetical protein
VVATVFLSGSGKSFLEFSARSNQSLKTYVLETEFIHLFFSFNDNCVMVSFRISRDAKSNIDFFGISILDDNQ